MKALIPAAGLGTRFLPATKSQPKEMLMLYDRPTIQYVVEEGLDSGADEVVIINSRTKVSIEQYFSPDPELSGLLRERGKDAYAEAVEHAGSLNVSYVYQDEPLGLGHAVHCAADAIDDEPFFVLLGDVVVPDNTICPRMLEVSRAHGGANVIAALEIPDSEITRYGIIDGVQVDEGIWKVNSLVEKPKLEDAPSNMASFGRYLLTPRVMKLLGEIPPGAGGEIQLTDALDAVLSEEEMYAVVISGDEGFDVGTPEAWLAANVALFARHRGV